MRDQFRDCLERLDVAGVRAIWATVAPHLPVPPTDELTLVAIHRARTQAESVRFPLRAYSHRWLEERGLPSGLPDALRPKAERMYPVVAEAVGISVTSSVPGLAKAVQGAMSEAVLDAYASGRREPEFVKARMLDARDRVKRSLLGR
jgi:hypothetical protein